MGPGELYGKIIEKIEVYEGEGYVEIMNVFYMADKTIFVQVFMENECPEFFQYSKKQLDDEIRHGKLELQ